MCRKEDQMRRLVGSSALIVFLFGIANAQQQAGSRPTTNIASESQNRLPVRRVVLYKNGIGYFEHSGRVRGNQDLNIDFTTAQLNDVLKSLTVVDLGEGRITGVRFNSVAPLSERLKALRLPLSEQTSRADFLRALRGTRVEVRSGASTATGKVLSVETGRKLGAKGEQVAEVTELSLVTENGELRSFELGPATTVRVADRELGDEIGRYLNLIGSAKAMDSRRMTISAAGTGEREIFVSYISEVPVWKSTYRILLPDKAGAKPLVQGWAIVDNTVGEDWKDVQLSLVAGAPQSFVQEISQPYYVRRPVVALPESVTLTPQTHEAAMAPPPPPPAAGPGFAGATAGLEGTVKDPSGAVIPNARVTVRNEETGISQTTATDSQGYYRFNNIQPGNSALYVDSPGFNRFVLSNIYLGVGRMNEIHPTLNLGGVSQTVEVQAAPSRVATSTSSVSHAIEEEQPEAEGKAVGDLFKYDLKQKVTIGKNQSALVPILQARIDAEKVTLWNEDSDGALRALWITNTSGMTLDAGSFNVHEEETFAGEGMLDAVRPGERRLVSYAADPAVRVRIHEDSTKEPISRVRINKGLMLLTKEERESKTYTIFNSDSSLRQVIIEHPARSDWKLTGKVKPEESSASFHRFRVKVEPKQTAQLVVEEYRPDTTQLDLTDLTTDYVSLLAEQKRVTPAMEQAFRRVLEQKSLIARLDEQLKSHQQEVEAITADQSRVRENMKALKGSAEEKALLQRYIHQFDAQEDRLSVLHTQTAELKGKSEQASKQLDEMLAEITLDEAF